jgi:Xaa-Pro aminopeptidase
LPLPQRHSCSRPALPINVTRFILGCLACLLGLLSAQPTFGQRSQYPEGEFQQRRTRLCEQMKDGTLLLFSATLPRYGVRFRQDHDYYYLTGDESKNAVLLLEASDCQAHLFLPHQGDREKFIDGPNWLENPEAGKAKGFEVHNVAYLGEYLARKRRPGIQKLWVRLSERDEIDQSRSEKSIFLGRQERSPFGGQPSEDAWRISELRSRYPFYDLNDATPYLDRLRMIKTEAEIDILRRAGAVSARGIAKAIAATRPGAYEYELEAEAKYVFLREGSEMEAYPAIVGSGPNGNLWHYNSNQRQMQDGDLIVMDYGGSWAYQTMDITRTWPVNGKFDEVQERAYRAVLEAQKAIIAAMRPGATRAETRDICRKIYDKWGFEDKPAHGAGHFVGMAVHDVGDSSLPFEPGMVIAVEPIIEIPERNIHIRIEDTVLVTEGAPEVLSAEVPKEVEDLLAIVGNETR